MNTALIGMVLGNGMELALVCDLRIAGGQVQRDKLPIVRESILFSDVIDPV